MNLKDTYVYKTYFETLTGPERRPDMILVTKDQWLEFYEAMLPQQRFHDVKLSEAGVDNFLFCGVPVVKRDEGGGYHLLWRPVVKKESA